jgi:hypothetical protein
MNVHKYPHCKTLNNFKAAEEDNDSHENPLCEDYLCKLRCPPCESGRAGTVMCGVQGVHAPLGCAVCHADICLVLWKVGNK